VDLLRMLFLYASSKFSFRILAVEACALGIAAISDTAWCKRFPKVVLFLCEMLHSMLSLMLPPIEASALHGVKNVLLMDASVIRQEENHRCPACGNPAMTETGDSFIDYDLNFCNYCGQALKKGSDPPIEE